MYVDLKFGANMFISDSCEYHYAGSLDNNK